MRDLYEVFNDLNLEEEKDLEVMNDLEKQKWKKKLRKEIKKPVKTGRSSCQRRLPGNRSRAVFIICGLGSTGSSKTGGRGNL